MGIGQVHSTTDKHVFIGVSAGVAGLLPALDESISRGLPLRVVATDLIAMEDLRRIQAFAMGYLPVWRWVWELPASNRSADLHHLPDGGL